MKKFISMVMAAAMVASLVPATAFAKGEVTATAKVVDAWEETKDFNGQVKGAGVPEAQLKVTGVDYQNTYGELPTVKVTFTLDNADFDFGSATTVAAKKTAAEALFHVEDEDGNNLIGTTATGNQGGTINTTKVFEADPDGDKIFLDSNNNGIVDSSEETATNLQNFNTWVANNAAISAVRKTAAQNETAALDNEMGAGNWEKKWSESESAYVYVNKTTGDYITVQEAGGPFEATPMDDPNVQSVLASEIARIGAAGWVRGFVTTQQTQGTPAAGATRVVEAKCTDVASDEVEFEITGFLAKDDIIFLDLVSVMDKTSEGKKATVSIDSKMVTADDLVYVTILGKGLKASVKKTVDVAEEEVVKLNDRGLKIESVVGDLPSTLTLKISKGFEFTDKCNNATGATVAKTDDNELTVTGITGDEITIFGLEIEATTAKSGAVATITVKSAEKNNTSYDSASVEVAQVVDYKVVLSVDEDEDIPVIYSGVDVDNTGITDDSDHLSLEVTAEETFPGAWSFRKGFNFELPEGVYVTNVEVTDVDGILKTTTTADDRAGEVNRTAVEKAFYNAYQDGDHLNFEFEKRVFDDVDATLNDDCATMTFQLELVADPTFEGDVVLKLTGDLVDEQEVTIAKFVKPYTVKAEQNDMIIDYRYTEVPTVVTITEAEAGLWDKGATFTFTVDDNDTELIVFEDGEFVVDKDSELELKKYDDVDKNGATFTVKAISDEAATVTLQDMSLFMQRNIPAGPYDLKISTSLADAYEAQPIFAADEGTFANDACTGKHDDDKECFVGDVCDYSSTVKEAFVNVVTAGRDKDDASFTTKVVVPVGESYIIAGETQIALDVPAYISADGYTMLPVRAVATALGILNNNVLWDQATKTVTILYGQRIITMVAGQKVVYVNGSAIPASASVEIVDGRTFLPMRDLATALGVTDITWDAATKTATLNGNQ